MAWKVIELACCKPNCRKLDHGAFEDAETKLSMKIEIKEDASPFYTDSIRRSQRFMDPRGYASARQNYIRMYSPFKRKKEDKILMQKIKKWFKLEEA